MHADLAALAGRTLLALVFLPNGLMKLGDLDGTAAYFEQLGFPFPFVTAALTGCFELAGAALLLVGVATGPVGLAFAVFCLAAATIGHLGQGGDDPERTFLHLQAFLKDIGLAGGFLMLVRAGPGRFRFGGR